MEEHPVDPALDSARKRLRVEQPVLAGIAPPSSIGQSRTDAALERLQEITRFKPTEEPNTVRRGAFKYDRELESERIGRAQSLILRVAPGPFEDPNYFAILAYQAASVEMAYRFIPEAFKDKGTGQGASRPDLFSKFLLGTVHAPVVNAFSDKVAKDGYSIVLLKSGLVDFIYQAAKAVVEALNPSLSDDDRSGVTERYDPEMVRARLVSDPGSVERLYRTLEAYFFRGYPRASWGETIPQEYDPVLGLLVGLAERWVIGHEYGHGLLPWGSLEQLPRA